MTRHRSRLGRLGRTASTVPPPTRAVLDARDRTRIRLLARIRRAAGVELTDAETDLLDDRDQAAADLDTYRRDLRAQGVDPDRDADVRRARMRERLDREAARTT